MSLKDDIKKIQDLQKLAIANADKLKRKYIEKEAKDAGAEQGTDEHTAVSN